MENTQEKQERLILFSAQKKTGIEQEALESLEELEELVKTAGAVTLFKMLQKVESIHSGHYLGSGKVQELKQLIQMHEATGVVCDEELSPMQMRNLSELLETKVMDRTMIILDIFAQRARSKEGKLQVELAQLRYQYSRLSGFGQMLSRQGGGIGTRGPGEQKLETDKRHLRSRMDLLKKEIEEIGKHRGVLRSGREKNKTPVVAIVGYTNAGKSTLLNTLSGSDVYAEDQLFATLDPTVRGINLPSGTSILLTDTVGFIRKLPHHLVKAFYATLEEAKYADIILHVIDASSPHMHTHKKVVYETLDHLKIKDIPTITVYNKVDKVTEKFSKEDLGEYQIEISAKESLHLEELLNCIEDILYEKMKFFTIQVPYTSPEILAFCHQHAEKLEESYENEGVFLKGYLHKDKIYKIKPYFVENQGEKA